jgi:hypothetical protein
MDNQWDAKKRVYLCDNCKRELSKGGGPAAMVYQIGLCESCEAYKKKEAAKTPEERRAEIEVGNRMEREANAEYEEKKMMTTQEAKVLAKKLNQSAHMGDAENARQRRKKER